MKVKFGKLSTIVRISDLSMPLLNCPIVKSVCKKQYNGTCVLVFNPCQKLSIIVFILQICHCVLCK